MRAKGFSLIEILVVLIIISITLGFALLAFGDFGTSRRAVVAAEQFSTYLKLVEQQAILEMATLGIDVQQDGYRTYRFEQGKSWVSMSEKSIFHSQFFPNNVIVRFQSHLKNNTKNPDIIINASGEITPFTLSFGTHQKPVLVSLTGLHNGELSLIYPKS